MAQFKPSAYIVPGMKAGMSKRAKRRFKGLPQEYTDKKEYEKALKRYNASVKSNKEYHEEGLQRKPTSQ
jgi:hypothetical protein